MPREDDIVGLNPAGSYAFYVSITTNKFGLKQAPHRGATELIFLKQLPTTRCAAGPQTSPICTEWAVCLFYLAGLINEGAAAVALAGVLAALGQAGANHGIGDFAGAVGLAALGVGDDRDGDLLEVGGQSRALL